MYRAQSRDSTLLASQLAIVGGVVARQDASGRLALHALSSAVPVLPAQSKNGRKWRGSLGRRVASWGVLQSSAGTASLISTDIPPFPDGATKVLQLTHNATPSYGQQNPVDDQSWMVADLIGGHANLGSGGTNAGLWVKNPGSSTLAFELRIYNVAANRNMFWYGSVDPGDWRFLTLSPAQYAGNSWTYGTDLALIVRVTEMNTLGTDTWTTGDTLLIGPVYLGCYARPRFNLMFDDGLTSIINPISAPLISTGKAVTSSSSNVFTTAATHQLQIGEPILFTDTAPTSLSVNTTYWVQTTPAGNTFTLAVDSTLVTTVSSTGFSGTANYQYAGTSSRSVKEVVEQYGFRGTCFLIGSKIGASGYMTASEIQQIVAAGWTIGSHSNTHPQNNENAGLMLLGPYGYYLSQLTSQGIIGPSSLTPANRRVTSTSGSTLTCEANHQFLADMPIVFTDVAPGNLSLDTVYYVLTPSGAAFGLATTVGGSAISVGSWTGTANYRYSGSANDDSAIYADVVAGAAAVAAVTGNTQPQKYLALPQGGWDKYVRSACIRAGFSWVRGISSYNNAHTIPIGMPTGGGTSNTMHRPGGWLSQIDAVQTDGAITIPQIKQYVDDCISLGALGGNYHHALSVVNLPKLDQLCSYLRTKAAADAIDVMTIDEMNYQFGN